MRRQPEVPRWRRSRYQPQPQVIKLSGRAARRYARQAYAQPQPAPAVQGSAAHIPVPGAALAARTGGFRFRRHLVPFAWLAVLLGAGLGIHRSGSLREGVTTGLVLGFLIAACSWRMAGWTRNACAAASVLTAAFVPLLAAIGWNAPVPPVVIAGWLAVAVPWLHRYRWRPSTPEPVRVTDQETFGALAAEKHWNATLGAPEALPGGGQRFPVQTDGIKTTIGNILSASENVAGAWHKPMTEAYAERSPDGITSRGFLTVLGQDTLMRVREWDGKGIDPADGTAVIGRYADGKPARVKFCTPRYGTRNALICGTSGAGKTATLDLLIYIALASGFIVPVILDPQEGQSLPFWRDKVLYASGISECIRMQRGLHAGMMDRSAYLADLDWDDDGLPMHGMNMFDHKLTGLPVVMVIFDEAHMVLSGTSQECRETVRLTMEMGRLGRKTGVAVWLDTHLPALSDLGGEQALRDMLRGGNALGLRTANSVAAGMLGLEKDLGQIPMYFQDGSETCGLAYLAGPDNRPDAPMRTDLVPRSARAHPPPVPKLDDRFAAAMARAMSAGGVPLDRPASAPETVPEPDDSAPEGRTAADAVLAVLVRRMDRGEILKAAGDLVTKEWGRDRAFTMRAVGAALEKLAKEKRIRKQGRNVYEPAPVSGPEGQG